MHTLNSLRGNDFVHRFSIIGTVLWLVLILISVGCSPKMQFEANEGKDTGWLVDAVIRVPTANPLTGEVEAAGRISYGQGSELHSRVSVPENARVHWISTATPQEGGPAVVTFSGGGAYGAFGIGVMRELHHQGTDLTKAVVVFGVSAGSFQAMEAFAATDSSFSELHSLFVETHEFKLLGRYTVAGMLGLAESKYSSRGIFSMVTRRVGELLPSLAQRQREGRRLFVSTTNSLTGELYLWNVGWIAEQAEDLKESDIGRNLIALIIMASASAPYYFPPQWLPSEPGVGPDGVEGWFLHQHVDGGVGQNVIGPKELWSHVPGNGPLMIVRNGPRQPHRVEPFGRAIDGNVPRSISIWIGNGEQRGVEEVAQVAFGKKWTVIEYFLPIKADPLGAGKSFDFSRETRRALCERGRQAVLGTLPEHRDIK